MGKIVRLFNRHTVHLIDEDKNFLLIHDSPLTDALSLLVSKSDGVTTT